jgi:hypothetical protein
VAAIRTHKIVIKYVRQSVGVIDVRIHLDVISVKALAGQQEDPEDEIYLLKPATYFHLIVL